MLENTWSANFFYLSGPHWFKLGGDDLTTSINIILCFKQSKTSLSGGCKNSTGILHLLTIMRGKSPQQCFIHALGLVSEMLVLILILRFGFGVWHAKIGKIETLIKENYEEMGISTGWQPFSDRKKCPQKFSSVAYLLIILANLRHIYVIFAHICKFAAFMSFLRNGLHGNGGERGKFLEM